MAEYYLSYNDVLQLVNSNINPNDKHIIIWFVIMSNYYIKYAIFSSNHFLEFLLPFVKLCDIII